MKEEKFQQKRNENDVKREEIAKKEPGEKSKESKSKMKVR